MKLIIITNNDLPHIYFSNKICKIFEKKIKVIVFMQEHLNKTNFFRSKIAFLLSYIFYKPIFKEIFNGYYLSIDRFKKFRNYFANISLRRNFFKIDLKKKKDLKKIKKTKYDMMIVLGGKKIPKSIVTNIEKTIHLHCGIVPYYKGGSTWFSNFRKDDFENLGFTIQKLDDGYDTGKIINQYQTKLTKGDSIWDAYCKTIIAGTHVTILLIKKFLNKKYLKSSKQKTNGFSHTAKFLFDKKRKSKIINNYYVSRDIKKNKKLIVNEKIDLKHKFIC